MEILKGVKFNKFISENRESTLRYLRSKYDGLSFDDVEDIYQESSIALYNNIETGKLHELSSSLYTYFLKICINQSLKALRSQGKTIGIRLDGLSTEISQKSKISDKKLNEVIQLSPFSPESPKSPDYVYEMEEMKLLVKEALSKMPTKCQKLLKSYYFDELSWSVIADNFDIKGGADSAKVQASKCRKGFEEKNKELKRLYNFKKGKNN